jgi:hypothetical protein
MKYLYFVGYSSMTPVFWTGIAFWIIFMIAPIRALLGTVKRYRRPPVAVGLSYSRLLGGMRLGVGDVYAPVVPKTCSRKFKHQVAETFAQLAPAAFDSILNGEEIAHWINGDYPGYQAPWTPTSFGNASNISGSKELRRQLTGVPGDTSRASFTGSIAAGIHETLNLLWRPLDPDHPEDVYLRRSRPATGRADQLSYRQEGMEEAYGVDEDLPIRAVYSSSLRQDHDAFNFAPLGSGLSSARHF